jgi:group II intron reverse transcriptase/maturase
MELLEGNMASTSELDTVSTKRQRIATLAEQSPMMGFTSLAYFIDLDWLREAYHRTRKDGAVGVDGQTAEDYAVNLDENLQSLLDRAKSGTYKAPPVRRVHIPKGTGDKTRPIGIPTFEDKVLQRSVTMVLEAVYEQDFLDCSYGFRPGRSPHQALAAFRRQIMSMQGGWILELDIEKFFDNLDHSHLRDFVGQRIRDGVLKRLIGKWLHAGVMTEGCLSYPEAGCPQGGVVSPILSNVYLHNVLDEWFEREVKPRMRGRAFLVRFADDAVMGFSCEQDAKRVLDVLPRRFARYGLKLHPTKTRLVPFLRPPLDSDSSRSDRRLRVGTFELLGFTHYWGRSQKGNWVVKVKTAGSRFSRATQAISKWCRRHRHEKVREQHRVLCQKLKGHYAYYGLTGNYEGLHRFYETTKRIWKKWLSRRSQRGYLDWVRFGRILRQYPLPPPVVVHSVYRSVANP